MLGCTFQPPSLTSMQRILSNMPGWMMHKLKSRLPGEILTASDMQTIPLTWQKGKRNQRTSWWRWKRSQKAVLKLSIQKVKIMPLILSVSVQPLSHFWLFVTPWAAALQASLSITNSQSLLKLMSFESMMPSNHFILCCPFSSSLQSYLASGSFQVSQLFASSGQSIGVLASVQSFQWTFRADLFRMDCLDLLAVQGTLKSLPQHHSSKASTLRCSAFFILQLSHPCMTTGKPQPRQDGP